MLEKEIESKLRKSIRALENSALCLKFESPGFAGVPDRVILLPGGRLLFVELKSPGKKERVRQRYVQELLRDLGFEVFSAVDGQEGIDRVVERCREILAGSGKGAIG